ncbi:hypothetical protein C2E23DRAFT_100775 [Lenzites betulinus]|nr:hypothetical protein C2E23DRAFT_100775 [Lenzites betulinus]
MTAWPSCSSSNAQYAPLFNQKSQDPCTITEKLFIPVCYASVDLNNLPSVAHFVENPCLCSTVFYSLAYVCSQCGNSGVVTDSWAAYSNILECGDPSIQSYSQWWDPSSTSIPAWAYLPLGSDGRVDLANALAVAAEHLPDMTTAGGTVVPVPKPSSTDLSPPSLRPTPAPTTSSSSPQDAPLRSTTLSSPLSFPIAANTVPAPHDVTPILADQTSSTGASSIAATFPSTTTTDEISRLSGAVSPSVPGSAITAFRVSTSASDPSDSSFGGTPLPSQSHTSETVTTTGAMPTATTTDSPQRWFFMSKSAFIRTSAGLSAAAFVSMIIVILLFRRDRRICKAEKLAQRARPYYNGYGGNHRWRRLECADECTP